MTQAVSIVGVLVPGDDLVDTLPQQRECAVPHAFLLARVVRQPGPVACQMVAFIEGPQRQQAGIAGDLTTGKIGSNGSMLVEGKTQLCYTTRCYFWVLRKRMLGSAKTQCSSTF